MVIFLSSYKSTTLLIFCNISFETLPTALSLLFLKWAILSHMFFGHNIAYILKVSFSLSHFRFRRVKL